MVGNDTAKLNGSVGELDVSSRHSIARGGNGGRKSDRRTQGRRIRRRGQGEGYVIGLHEDQNFDRDCGREAVLSGVGGQQCSLTQRQRRGFSFGSREVPQDLEDAGRWATVVPC